jgi:hypothetical protein
MVLKTMLLHLNEILNLKLILDIEIYSIHHQIMYKRRNYLVQVIIYLK